MSDYQKCLDRLYKTTTTNASTGITRKQAYDKMQELVDLYGEMVNYPYKLEAEVERLRAENDKLEEELYEYQHGKETNKG